MPKVIAKAGDLIAIPLDGQFVIGRVIFVSNIFEEIMQIEFRGPFKNENDSWQNGDEIFTLFTAASKFAKRGWKIVDTGISQEDDIDKTLRIIADDVWLEDKIVRKANSEDMKKIKTMYVDGFIRVEKLLRKALGN
ncbi:hypothetical protein LNTAR_05051 [Lentisphaera araneosa HTCC2155]|jgi:hypothetical protein|uniref:Uncharacterized protein n=1 Tax=Lentisphaera araneosa HTCC2155 TaxID=313628 RepID=A6DLJ7_9BACT|nr:hypothetical protein [Lentisphaera araneosa]EDM27452.1 hypothetical protein LNTAR_05051 [Lentisphaera araneosa HTCC2155]